MIGRKLCIWFQLLVHQIWTKFLAFSRTNRLSISKLWKNSNLTLTLWATFGIFGGETKCQPWFRVCVYQRRRETEMISNYLATFMDRAPFDTQELKPAGELNHLQLVSCCRSLALTEIFPEDISLRAIENSCHVLNLYLTNQQIIIKRNDTLCFTCDIAKLFASPTCHVNHCVSRRFIFWPSHHLSRSVSINSRLVANEN